MTLAISLIGTIGTIIVAWLGVKATKDAAVSEKDLQDAIEGADRNVYKKVEKLNRQLLKDISDKQIKADVENKNRIARLNYVKDLLSSYASELYALIDSINILSEAKSTLNKRENLIDLSKEAKKDYDDEMKNILKKNTLDFEDLQRINRLVEMYQDDVTNIVSLSSRKSENYNEFNIYLNRYLDGKNEVSRLKNLLKISLFEDVEYEKRLIKKIEALYKSAEKLFELSILSDKTLLEQLTTYENNGFSEDEIKEFGILRVYQNDIDDMVSIGKDFCLLEWKKATEYTKVND